jgi:hypothetical protein
MTAADVARQLADRAEAVVFALLGEPIDRSTRELRFGKRHTVSVAEMGCGAPVSRST